MGSLSGNPPWPSKRVDVCIVGGGITGAATARELARAGADTVLLESEGDVNTAASGRNAGSLHGQIQFPPFRDHGVEWARSYLPALAFLRDSLALWDQLGDACEVQRHGGLMVAEDPAHIAMLETKVALERSIGIDSQMLDQAALQAMAPYLSTSMIGAAWCPIEGKANSLKGTPVLLADAELHGARTYVGCTVLAVEAMAGGYRVVTAQGTVEASHVVLAANAGLAELVRPLHLRLPITDEPIQASVSEPVAPLIDHLVYYCGEKLTLKQTRAGTLLIGGGWPAHTDASGHHSVNPESLRANLAVAMHVVPRIASARIVRTWTGVGNGTPDDRPLIGSVPGHPGIIVGMFPYEGFTAGPLMGRVLADLVLGHTPDRDLEPFAVDRFA